MNGSKPDFHPRDRGAEESNAVWALLKQAPMAEPDAWFAARTLARCRNESASSRGVVLDRVWRWAIGTGLAVCAAILLVTHLPSLHPAAPLASTPQKNVQEAFEIMASMAPDADSPSTPDSAAWQD